MNRYSNQCNQMYDINQIALKNFYEDCQYLGDIQRLDKSQRFEALKKLLTYHQHSQSVRNDQRYVEMWLEVAKLVQDKELVYVYMHTNDIGQGNVYFYKAWIEMYTKRKQFILSYQLQKQTKRFFSEEYYNKYIQNLIEYIEKMISEKYMNQQRKNVVRAYHDNEGISEKDFQILNDLTIEKRINEVETQIFGIFNRQSQQNQDQFSKSKTRCGMSVENQGKKRYSDLINMKNVSDSDKNGVFFYIEEKYRSHFISKVEQLIYEISYYEKKYENINPSGNKGFIDHSKFKFWLEQPKIQFQEEENYNMKNFLRISNAINQDKKQSYKFRKDHHNSPTPTKKRNSYFECKKNRRKKFKYQEIEEKITEFDQISTCENLNEFDVDVNYTPLNFNFYYEESNSSINCQQRLRRPDYKLIKDNVISELPRNDRNSFLQNNQISQTNKGLNL